MAITLTKITEEQHRSAIEWIMDAFPHQWEEAADLSPMQAYRVIRRQYCGGWAQFLADSAPLSRCVWCNTWTERWDQGNPDCGC